MSSATFQRGARDLDRSRRHAAHRGCGRRDRPQSPEQLRLGSGLAPVRAMLDCGLAVGIGTTPRTPPTRRNVRSGGAWAPICRGSGGRTTPSGFRRPGLHTGDAGSCSRAGLRGKLGAIAPAAFADLVFLDLGHIDYVPLRDTLLQLVNAESGAAIEAVMVGGRLILRDGRLLTVDEARLRRDVEAARADWTPPTRARCGSRGARRSGGRVLYAQARAPGLPRRRVDASSADRARSGGRPVWSRG